MSWSLKRRSTVLALYTPSSSYSGEMWESFPTPAVLGFKTVVPFISQIATLPLLSCQTMSLLPSPLKSPVPTMDQVVRTFPTPAVLGFQMVVPFISQIPLLPLVSRHTISLLPPPSKSWQLTILGA